MNKDDFSASTARLRAAKGLVIHLKTVARMLEKMPREEMTPGEGALADHGQYLLCEAETLVRELRHAPPLPARGKTPRILTLAREIVEAGEYRVVSPLILRQARAFFQREPLQREICSLEAALRCALWEEIDREALRGIRRLRMRRRAARWAARFSAGRIRRLPREDAVLRLGMNLLAEQGKGEAVRRADQRMRKENRIPEEESAEDGLLTAQAILSLRQLSRLPFDRLIERLNPVAAVLREEETYRRMDDAGRMLYQRQVTRLAKKYCVTECAVARAAKTLAEEKEGAEGEAGYYLLERPDRIAAYLLKTPAAWTRKHRAGLFLSPLYFAAAGSLILGAAAGAPPFAWPLIPLCFSEIARAVYFPLLRRRFPARPLPRIFLRRLDAARRTLVAVPALLTDRKQALHMARQLSVMRAANPDPYLDFLLLADFADSAEENMPQDGDILRAAEEAVRALNETGGEHFYYLHRGRSWNGECFAGRDRKRGALEMLNHLIADGRRTDAICRASFDPSLFRGRYAYVITLDADTFLPPGAVCQLVGAMEHPLQKGRVGVIQPRMETAADTVTTRVQALLGGRGGVDLYGLAVQDVYQDVLGRGSFVGKGIYRPAQWLEKLEGRLPEGVLLSHDLIEGEIVGSALASDIALYDGQPSSLAGWQKRLHRWTRGDWQLLPFLWDSKLDLLSRHKIWDNLRRSLAPAAQVILLLAGVGLRVPALALLALPWPPHGFFPRLLMLPGKAYTLLDAALRAVYRQGISHRKLLSWVTAAQAENGGQLPLPCLLAQIGAGFLLTLFSLLPGGLWPEALVGMLWMSGPIWAYALDRPIRYARPMTEKQRGAMRRLARDTWRFFEEQVNETTLFLPPDNVQLAPRRGVALRTSPTNIGLYLLSCCAAREMGFLTTAEMCRRLRDTLVTMEQLSRWKGHFYNWYELRGGEPLAPRFVSTVDSGNLAGCLFACAQLCRRHLPEMPEGMRDLPERMDRLFERMDFSALFDSKEELFFIGFDAEKMKPTVNHYDLLASEARLTSFLAIMTGQAPLRHWRRLNRGVVRAGGGPALLSWGGTLFEYLMPHLLLPLTGGTLMGEGCLNAVRAQRADRPDRPFGVSESGYYAFDADMNYQYRAFGLPALALSGETAGQVIAPYASLLALPFFPRSAAENALRMERLGWRDDAGFLEAADYTQGQARLVRSHMAHHQGMILCALCNALENNALVRAFMAPPVAKAYGYLLLEKAPASPRRRGVWRRDDPQSPPPGPCRRAPRKDLPLEAQALSAGHLTWVLSARGQGYLSWKEKMITRFDPEEEETGPQLYVRDSRSGAFFRPAAEGAPRFESGGAHYTAAWEGLKTRLSCCVSPLTAAAVWRLTVENPGKEAREAEAVSFLETALGSQADDQAHPCFRDLGVRILPWGDHGLLAQRLPRDREDGMPYAGHFAVGEYTAIRRQGDRGLFLGRMGSYAAPEQLALPGEKCAFRTGDTTAPCLSLRLGISLQPGEKKTVYFVTLTRDDAQPLPPSFLRAGKWQEAFSLAYSQDQALLRSLRMDPGMLGLYQQVLGAVLFTGQPHQAALPAAPRTALWRVGVSGSLPAWAVRCGKADAPLIRHALRCHAWMRRLGVRTDLILLCPEETQYRRPVQDAVRQLLCVSPERDFLGCPGGVALAAADEDRALQIESLCRLTLRAGQPLREQLAGMPRFAPERREKMEEPQPVVPAGWEAEHIFGGFTPEGDYRIVRPAPVPWHNILCNEQFGTLVCETGILYSYFGNSRLGRITRMSGDVRRGNRPGEEIFLLDEQGVAWPLTRPAAVHGPGVTEYHCKCGGVSAALTVFTAAGWPAGIRTAVLRSDKPCRVTLGYTVHFALGENARDTRCRAVEETVLAAQGDLPGVAWAALQGGIGRVASARAGASGDQGNTALFLREVTLQPHVQEKVTMALGYSAEAARAIPDCRRLLSQNMGLLERQTRQFWARRLGKLTLYSGESDMERMMNRWLPYQTYASRLMARMGPYQPGGAFGFRDQLQDLLLLLPTDPAYARSHILLCAAHQYPEGDVQHWWHPPRRGVRTRVSDDRLFLPYIAAQYVKITGDESILEAQAPYVESLPLGEEEADRYEEPAVTAWTESLLRHCIRAIDSVKTGEHGLPLMGSGDWNDGMNRVGGRRGESVWLGFFLILVLKEFSPLCDQETRERYTARRRGLQEAAESAWTGQWYLRAWRDDGTPLGGPGTRPPRIDLISQAFAVLSGAPRTHARMALTQALRWLYHPKDALVQLLAPPFSPEENAGYIGAYLPGVRENGGQYTHAVPWLILALCKVGEYEKAWEIARAMLPPRRGDSGESLLRYRAEPYVLAGDIYTGENFGRAGWTWYTGSATWLYHTILTALLGFEKRGDRVRFAPCPGSGMEEFSLVYAFGSSRWHFTASRDTVFSTVDGEKLADGWATLTDDGRTHEVRVPLK